ncbi:MAG: hypothetical protein JO360_04390 [Acidobacteria bacterium]|nr:hypothetical protein [Acidobacteriota bacterium]
MSFRQSLIICCLLLLAVQANAAAAPCAGVRARPDAWMTGRVDALVRAAHAAYEDDDALEAYQRVLGDIAFTLRQCRLNEDAGFVGRHRQFVEYIEAVSLDQLPGHELGFIVPDRQYFDETRRYVQIPEFLLSQSFLRAVSRDETLEQAKAFLRGLNAQRDEDERLIFFSYISQHLGTPDNDDSFERLLIVVPGDATRGVPEKWVQFGVTDKGARTRIRNVSVVSAVTGADGTYNAYFKDYYRTYRRDGSISIKGRWELGYGDDNCVQCHKSGILPIFPEAGSVSPDEQSSVAAVNDLFQTYGSPRFENYLDTSKFGPGLGSAASESSCAACHQQTGLGSLSWPMDSTLISSYVKGGRMPFGSKLRESERDELYEKLIQDYFNTDAAHPGILKSWLLGKPPEHGSLNHHPPL